MINDIVFNDYVLGQEKMLSKIKQHTYMTLPNSIILEGDKGCGKHTLVNLLSKMYDVEQQDISLQIDNEFITTTYINVIPTLYIIDIIKASQNKRIINLQNSILKFIEEPPINCKIIILCTNISQLLDTIRNRCIIYKFQPYTTDTLVEFTGDKYTEFKDSMFEIYDTPGKVLTADISQYVDMVNLCQNIIKNINRASVPNTLTLLNKFDFGKGGYDVDIFMHTLLVELKHLLIEDNNTYVYNMFCIVKDYISKLSTLNINKEQLITSFLLALKIL